MEKTILENRQYISIFLIAIALCFYACGTEGVEGEKKDNFHIYLLMGQSNMAGRGMLESQDTSTHPRVFMLDKNDAWVLAKDPVHFDKPIAGVGLGLTFGKTMANQDDHIKIGLVPCAKGGSSINKWFKDSLHQATNSFPYNEMISKAKKALADGELKGILWHQGESDANSETNIEQYREKFYAMLDAIKNDLGIDHIPVVIGELGHFTYANRPLRKEMNKALARLASNDKHIALVKADGLTHKGDSLHFDSESYRKLGKEYAIKMKELQSTE